MRAGRTLIFTRVLAALPLPLPLPPAPSVWPAAEPARAQTLSVHSAADARAMRPLIEAFEARTPGARVEDVEFQTLALHRAMLELDGRAPPDVVISSAMDLQVDLVNRGLARRIQLPPQAAPPPWAAGRKEIFGVTVEPAAMIHDAGAVSKAELPSSRRDLAAFVPRGAQQVELATRFIGVLLSEEGRRIIAERTPLQPVTRAPPAASQIERQIRNRLGALLPIRLAPGLPTCLDELERKDFLFAWRTAVGRREGRGQAPDREACGGRGAFSGSRPRNRTPGALWWRRPGRRARPRPTPASRRADRGGRDRHGLPACGSLSGLWKNDGPYAGARPMIVAQQQDAGGKTPP